MKRTIALLTLLGLVGAASAGTIANWRFEEGASTGHHDGFYQDTSGNENHLSAWTNTQNPVVAAEVPFTSQGGVTNTVALDFDGWTNKDNIGTWGTADVHDKMIDSLSFTNGWTIEGTFNTREWNWGNIVTKNGKPFDIFEPTLRTQVRFDNHNFAFGFIDGSTNWVQIDSIDPVHLNRWYSFAGTYDTNGTFSLYLKQQDGGDYVLQGTMTNVFGATLNYDTNFWKVASGTADGNPEAEFFNGIIDEVKISDSVLTTNEFINQDGFTIPFDIETPHGLAQKGFSGWDIPFDLIASEYWSPAGEVFVASDWQISTDDTFATLDWAANTGLLTITVPGGTLVEDIYYARVRYLSASGTSEWSDAYLLNLIAPETIAWWRFEKAAGMLTDSSGNGNSLQSLAPNTTPSLTDEIPYITEMPDNLTTNSSALLNPFLSELEVVDGAMINGYSFTNGWTIEATFKTKESDIWHSILALQGKPNAGYEQCPISFKQNPRTWGMHVEVLWFSDDLERDWLSTGAMELGKWYTLVATYDNEKFRLYLRSEGDADFVMLHEFSSPEGSSMDWPGVGKWVIGRGMWNGGANDWYNGVIDEIRITHGALIPEKFIHQSTAAAIMKPGKVNLVTFNGFDAPIRLGSSEFLCNGHSHTSSEWQILEGANVVWESGEMAGSTMLDVPPNTLASATYSAHVRYKASDGTWSDWSETATLDYTTMAHWKFEDGILGELISSSEDSSLYGNTLSQPYGTNLMPTATDHVAFATVPTTWEDNTLGYYGVHEKALLTDTASAIATATFPDGWTVEVTFKTDYTGGWQGVMGKDGQGAGDMSPFFMKIRGDGVDSDWSGDHWLPLEVGCVDDTDVGYSILTRSTMTPGVPAILAGQWYSVAATYDNDTLRFYLKGEGDSAYVLQGQRNVNNGVSFANFIGGVWEISAVTWFGTLAQDRHAGHIDEVKISSIALEPGSFIADKGAGWDSDGDGMADSWEIFYFGSIAANPGDNFDGDDRDNLTEYRQGGNPTVADLGHASSTGTVDIGGGTNAFEYVYPRRRFPYSGDTHRIEVNNDLIYGTWTNDGSVVVSGIGLLDIEFDAVTNQVPMDTDEKFIKLIIE